LCCSNASVAEVGLASAVRRSPDFRIESRIAKPRCESLPWGNDVTTAAWTLKLPSNRSAATRTYGGARTVLCRDQGEGLSSPTRPTAEGINARVGLTHFRSFGADPPSTEVFEELEWRTGPAQSQRSGDGAGPVRRSSPTGKRSKPQFHRNNVVSGAHNLKTFFLAAFWVCQPRRAKVGQSLASADRRCTRIVWRSVTACRIAVTSCTRGFSGTDCAALTSLRPMDTCAIRWINRLKELAYATRANH